MPIVSPKSELSRSCTPVVEDCTPIAAEPLPLKL
jgi:hypothetical protein